jgi:hypothetical protein
MHHCGSALTKAAVLIFRLADRLLWYLSSWLACRPTRWSQLNINWQIQTHVRSMPTVGTLVQRSGYGLWNHSSYFIQVQPSRFPAQVIAWQRLCSRQRLQSLIATRCTYTRRVHWIQIWRVHPWCTWSLADSSQYHRLWASAHTHSKPSNLQGRMIHGSLDHLMAGMQMPGWSQISTCPHISQVSHDVTQPFDRGRDIRPSTTWMIMMIHTWFTRNHVIIKPQCSDSTSMSLVWLTTML